MNIDLHPTVLSLLGLRGEHRVDGLDLSASVHGESQTGRERVYAETFYIKSKKSAVLDEEFMLIRDNRRDTNTLYARSDVAARTPLKELSQRARLSALLSAWEVEQDASVTGPARRTELNDETRQQLEAMGYIE